MMRHKYAFFTVILVIAMIVAGAFYAHAADKPAYWGKRCNKDDKSYCEVFQTVTIKQNNQKLLEFALGYPKDVKGAQAVVVLPLGFIMTDGIGLQVDEGQINKAMVRFCNASGCYVYMNLPEGFVTSMTGGKEMSVYFLDGSGKKVRIKMPLEGFAAKVKEVKS